MARWIISSGSARRVVAAVAVAALGAGCGAGHDGTTAPAPTTPTSPPPSSTATTATTTTGPSTTTTTIASYARGAPCADDVMQALLAAARRWATAHGLADDLTIVSVGPAQCAGDYAVGSMQCAYVNRPTWTCQGTGAIFHRAAAEWTVIREGDVDCATEPDATIRAACAAVGRAH